MTLRILVVIGLHYSKLFDRVSFTNHSLESDVLILSVVVAVHERMDLEVIVQRKFGVQRYCLLTVFNTA